MATTMTLIAKQTLTATTSTVTFSSIPQTFTDLKILVSARNTSGALGTGVDVGLNGNAVSSGKILFGDGATSYSASNTSSLITGGAGTTANTFSNGELYIPNYTSTNVKSASGDSVMENNANSSYAVMYSNLWSGATNAITTITLTPNAGPSFSAYSTFYLYGISNSSTQNTSGPYATGGDIISTDGTYWYHTFLSSGIFTTFKEFNCDYLVVAGGGGGGGGPQPGAGGGGAGGYRTSIGGTALTLTANTSYAATVGAGGTGGTSSSSTATGVQGGSSIFSTITSAGGGGGAGSINTDTVTSGSGGSGGGGARPQSSPSSMAGGAGNTPSVSPSQGNNGGSGYHNPGVASLGGGGGGASAVGGNAGGSTAGAGGAGTANSISGSSITYAGGGGGGADTGNNGAGGAGGGGAGGASPVAGTSNRGGGGGGSGNYNTAGANGGSGIIVLRYAV